MCKQFNNYPLPLLSLQFWWCHTLCYVCKSIDIRPEFLKLIFFLSFNNIYSEFQNIIFFGHMKEFFFKENYFYFYKFLGWIKCEKLNIFVFKVIPELLGENYYHYIIWQHFQSMMRQGYYRHNKISIHKI